MKNVLICNRGEIALRAIKACKDLGHRSFCIVNDNEKSSLVAKECDKAISFSDSINPFTSIDIIEKLIGQYQIDALYPGYGFLSEDPRLSQLCINMGITFIGPKPDVLNSLSSKRESINFAKSCQFNVLKIDDVKMSDFPIMLKAALGGGGRGNSIVTNSDDYNQCLDELKKRSQSLFLNDDIIIEKYLPSARHIELQFFSTDKKVHFLGTRDCSLQKSYQKFMEEGPGNDFFNSYLESKFKYIENSLLKLGYIGAGTIEFLWDIDTKKAYFLEVNTRIQVEHTITEELFDIDLVKAQIKFALDAKVCFKNLKSDGHSISCRIYAVDSRQGFTPDPGPIHCINLDKHMRWDTYIGKSGNVPHQYDPLIGKLVVHGSDRGQAIQKAIKCLRELNIHGVRTNKEFLLSVLTDEVFQTDKHSVSWTESSFLEKWTSSCEDKELDESELEHIWKTIDSSPEVMNGKSSFNGQDYYYSICGNVLWIERLSDGVIFIGPVAAAFWTESFAKNDTPYNSPITGKAVDVLVEVGDSVNKGDKLVVLEAMKTLVEVYAETSGIVKVLNISKDGLIQRGEVILGIE